MNPPLQLLIKRSAEFEDSLFALLDLCTFRNNVRSQLVIGLCSLAFEHAGSLRELIAMGRYTSGLAMLRLQYEALVRAVWLLYIASETDVAKLIAPLSLESAQKASNAQVSIADMLKAIDTKGPRGLFRHLNEFKDYSWRALNSYVHSGLHAVRRNSEGFPDYLLMTSIKQSNNLAHMTLMALAELSDDFNLKAGVMSLHCDFGDCMQLAM